MVGAFEGEEAGAYSTMRHFDIQMQARESAVENWTVATSFWEAHTLPRLFHRWRGHRNAVLAKAMAAWSGSSLSECFKRWLLVARRLTVSRGVSVAHHRSGLAARAFLAWGELMAARRLKAKGLVKAMSFWMGASKQGCFAAWRVSTDQRRDRQKSAEEHYLSTARSVPLRAAQGCGCCGGWAAAASSVRALAHAGEAIAARHGARIATACVNVWRGRVTRSAESSWLLAAVVKRWSAQRLAQSFNQWLGVVRGQRDYALRLSGVVKVWRNRHLASAFATWRALVYKRRDQECIADRRAEERQQGATGSAFAGWRAWRRRRCDKRVRVTAAAKELQQGTKARAITAWKARTVARVAERRASHAIGMARSQRLAGTALAVWVGARRQAKQADRVAKQLKCSCARRCLGQWKVVSSARRARSARHARALHAATLRHKAKLFSAYRRVTSHRRRRRALLGHSLSERRLGQCHAVLHALREHVLRRARKRLRLLSALLHREAGLKLEALSVWRQRTAGWACKRSHGQAAARHHALRLLRRALAGLTADWRLYRERLARAATRWAQTGRLLAVAVLRAWRSLTGERAHSEALANLAGAHWAAGKLGGAFSGWGMVTQVSLRQFNVRGGSRGHVCARSRPPVVRGVGRSAGCSMCLGVRRSVLPPAGPSCGVQLLWRRGCDRPCSRCPTPHMLEQLRLRERLAAATLHWTRRSGGGVLRAWHACAVRQAALRGRGAAFLAALQCRHGLQALLMLRAHAVRKAHTRLARSHARRLALCLVLRGWAVRAALSQGLQLALRNVYHQHLGGLLVDAFDGWAGYCRYRRWKARLEATAFQYWSLQCQRAAFNVLRWHTLRQRMSRAVVLKYALTLAARVLRAWGALVHRRKMLRATHWSLLHRSQASVLTHTTDWWHEWATSQRGEVSAVQMVVCRWVNLTMGRAFNTWWAHYQDRQEVHKKLGGILLRWTRQSLAQAWDTLVVYVDHRRRKHAADEHFRLVTLRAFLKAWREVAWLLPRIQAAVNLWTNGCLTVAWRHWRSLVAHANSRDELLAKVARRWMALQLASAFSSWRSHTSWKVNMQKAAKTIVLRMRHGAMLQCFDAWVGLLQQTHTVSEAASKLFHAVTARLAAQTAGGVFQAWHTHTQKMNRLKLVLAKILGRSMLLAWRAWRAVMEDSRQQDTGRRPSHSTSPAGSSCRTFATG
ncbi:MAG: hypothetical protein WDW38_007936 [Sanguina aurantia]